MATFLIEEYLSRADGTREVLGSYRIPETEPGKLAALLDVLGAQGLRAGGYSKTAVFLDGVPVNVFVDKDDRLEIVREPGPAQPEAADATPAPPEHVISINEYYDLPGGGRETFGIYRVPENDRRKAAAILEVASARHLRSGGYGGVAVYLDEAPVSASVDAHGELVLGSAGELSR